MTKKEKAKDDDPSCSVDLTSNLTEHENGVATTVLLWF
jgi:hypothetical protein